MCSLYSQLQVLYLYTHSLHLNYKQETLVKQNYRKSRRIDYKINYFARKMRFIQYYHRASRLNNVLLYVK